MANMSNTVQSCPKSPGKFILLLDLLHVNDRNAVQKQLQQQHNDLAAPGICRPPYYAKWCVVCMCATVCVHVCVRLPYGCKEVAAARRGLGKPHHTTFMRRLLPKTNVQLVLLPEGILASSS